MLMEWNINLIPNPAPFSGKILIPVPLRSMKKMLNCRSDSTPATVLDHRRSRGDRSHNL